MPATNTTAAAAGPRSLHAICELTRLAACGYCPASTLGQPCASSGTGPDGFHIARFAAACRRGLITAADFTAVTQAAGAFGNATLVYDDTLGGGR
jgi:hypothetical protein